MKKNFRYLFTFAVIYVAYIVAGFFGLLLAPSNAFVALVWPPSGIAVTAFFLCGYHYWPAIFLGGFIVSWVNDMPLWTSLFISGGGTVGALFGAWLLHRANFHPRMTRISDVTALTCLAALLSSLVCGVSGALTLLGSNLITSDAFWDTVLSWWLGDAVGIICIAPFIFTWSEPPSRWLSKQRILECILLFAMVLATCFILFDENLASLRASSYFFRPHLLFPTFIWAAIRFRQRAVTSATFLVLAVGVWKMLEGATPFPTLSAQQNLAYMQAFLGLLAITTMFLAAAISQYHFTLRQLRENEKEIHKQEADFRAFFELAGVGHAQIEIPSGKFFRVNQKLCDMLGYTAEELLEKTFLDITHPDDVNRSALSLESIREENSEAVIEKRYVRKDGGIVWALIIASAITDKHGRQRTLSVIHDVTERKHWEEKLKQAKNAADAANVAKGQFLANMSHEIRTPLGAVLGFTEFLFDPQQSLKDKLECARAIKRNGDMLLRVINDILDFSKIEAGKIELEIQNVSLNEILNDVSDAVELKVREKNLSLNIYKEKNVPARFASDVVRLRQILINIVDNAIKFSGGRHVDVIIDVTSDNKLEFLVKDYGVGISAAQAKHLFQPFHQADASTARKYGGTGLGLALSRNLARALGGDLILVDTAPDKGTTFRLTLPNRTVEVSMQQDNDNIKAPAPTSPVLQPLSATKVLLVEDATDIRFLVTRFLERAGATVDEAENGEEGIQMASKKAYDIILMDIQMPIVDGFQAISALRSQGYDKPVIALSAHAMKEDRMRSIAAGFDEHITKPVSSALLVETLKKYVPPSVLH